MKNQEEYQYLNLLKTILEQGTKHNDRTGTGTFRIWGAHMEFDLSEGKVPLLTTKKVPARLVIEELLWFLKGCTDVKLLQEKKVHIWDGNGSKEECKKFNREEGDLGPIYGHQWRNFGASKRLFKKAKDMWSNRNLRYVNRAYKDDGYDQIKYIIDTIKNNPDSRRILLSGWNPKEAHQVNPPPCHTFYQFQVEGDKINGSLYLRSNDIFLGNPFNIASLAILVHLLSIVTGKKAGKIVISIGDAHLYSDHIEQAKIQLEREPYNFPSIEINNRLLNKGLEGIMEANIDDFEVKGYKSHPTIKAKMSV